MIEEHVDPWSDNYEQWKKKEQERKDAVKKEYLRAVPASKNEADASFVQTAQALREAADNKDYGSTLTILDKVTIPVGHSFEIDTSFTGPDCDLLGGTSRLLIRKPDGQCDESVFEFLRFEESCMGAWQAYLLHQMWHYLPLWWHANYDGRDYLYSKEDPVPFEGPLPYFAKKEMIPPDFSRFDLAPETRFHEGKYFVSACYWSDFGGLIREYAGFTLQEGRMDEFVVFDKEILVEYHCGILF